MIFRKLRRFLTPLVFVFVVFTFSDGFAQSTNLLTNPGFEAPFVSINASPSGQSIANGWNEWSVTRSEGALDFENLMPEYYETVRNDRIREGSNAQRYESFFATHDAGVFQVVDGVGEGQEVTFTVWSYIWSSGFDDEDISDTDGDVLFQVGIDPTGGTNGTSDDIIWSIATENYDSYTQHSVSAITESDDISVWVRSIIGFPVKTSRIYIDDASLVVEGGQSSEEPTEEVTDEPTEEATEEPTEEATEETPTPEVTDETETPEATEETPTPEDSDSEDGGTGGPTDGQNSTGNEEDETPISEEFPGTLLHTVQRGDTVSRLATRYDSSISAIQQANGLGANSLIFVGQRLIIPVSLIPATSTPPPTPRVIVVTATPSGSAGGTGGPATADGVYIVQPGDTLSAIAREYNTTVAALAQLNGIVNANSILVGQRLNITVIGTGGPSDATEEPEETATPAPTQTPTRYVVQPGDNLYRIALRFGVSLADLIRVNNIADANRIFVGQSLTIPQ